MIPFRWSRLGHVSIESNSSVGPVGSRREPIRLRPILYLSSVVRNYGRKILSRATISEILRATRDGVGPLARDLPPGDGFLKVHRIATH